MVVYAGASHGVPHALKTFAIAYSARNPVVWSLETILSQHRLPSDTPAGGAAEPTDGSWPSAFPTTSNTLDLSLLKRDCAKPSFYLANHATGRELRAVTWLHVR